MKDLGKWSFIVGLILAILAGFLSIPYLAIILLFLGLIVGFLNITGKETQSYLVAVIALLVIGVASLQALSTLNVNLAGWVETVFPNFLVFVAASGLVVAIKAILELGKE